MRRVYTDPRYRQARAHIRRTQHTCWICGQPIDMQLRWPHPLSWSCDHIIPKAQLTPDDYRNWHASNLAAAHLRCNEARGAHTQPHHPVTPLDW